MNTTTTPEGAGEFPPLPSTPHFSALGPGDLYTSEHMHAYLTADRKDRQLAACNFCLEQAAEAREALRAQAAGGEQSAAQAAGQDAPWFGDKSPLHQSLCMAPERCAECARIASLAAAPAPAHPLPVVLATLRHVYANLVNGGVCDAAAAERIAKGLLTPAIAALETVAK